MAIPSLHVHAHFFSGHFFCTHKQVLGRPGTEAHGTLPRPPTTCIPSGMIGAHLLNIALSWQLKITNNVYMDLLPYPTRN